MVEIDCAGLTTSEINRGIRHSLGPEGLVRVVNPSSRHNLAVAVNHPGNIVFDGNVGYYCGGMLKYADVEVNGNCGWSVGEGMMSGSIIVRGNASAAVGAAVRGGTLVVHGSAGPRVGISQKGGAIVIGGDVGYMSGFMMQKGVLVICGDAGEALGDSLYEGRIYVGGRIEQLGNDTVAKQPDDEDVSMLRGLFVRYGIRGAPDPEAFTKIESGRRLYNFDKQDVGLWKAAL